MEYGRKEAVFDAFAGVAKALAHGKRLELLDLLAQGQRPVDALASAAALQVTTASAHLQALHRAGLVSRRREGTRVFYALAGDDVAALLTALHGVAERRVAAVELASRAWLDREGDEAPVVDVGAKELRRRARSGELVVLDVRPAEEFAAGHIPGARSIPVAELDQRLDELPVDAEVVAYCRGTYCVMSHDAVRLLRARGREARVLSEGMLEWRAAGEPVSA
jgi:rhodanese-related sulfurtransferase